jgi:hypothetical protein
MGLRPASNAGASLPSLSEFSFAHILKAIDPEIQDSIDAISLICARSAYSLADEYEAHLPPQGEIRAGVLMPLRGRHGLWIRTAGLDGNSTHALSVVHEQSSSSGTSEAGTMRSAYGSLRDVLEGKGKGPITDASSTSQADIKSSATWAVIHNQGSIVLLGPPQASRQVSRTSVIERASEEGHLEPFLASSLPPTPSAGMPSWLVPWKRPASPNSTTDRRRAEDALKDLVTPNKTPIRHS